MLTIQFGQCGNQLGHAMFSKISDDIEATKTGVSQRINREYTLDVLNKWYATVCDDGKRLARAILIDTEKKVINKVTCDKTKPWAYAARNIISQSDGGSANNWAYAYMKGSQKLYETVLNAIRGEVEKMDHFEGFLLLLSCAGGTGAGIGSYIVESLRNEYKTKCIVGAIVLPFTFGEVATQNYNTLLTLSKFFDQTDAIFLFENDKLNTICSTTLNNPNCKLQDINEVVSENLAAIFQTMDDPRERLNFLISRLTLQPSYKLATIRTVPYGKPTFPDYEPIYTWQSYVHHLKQTLKIFTANRKLTNANSKTTSSTMHSNPNYLYNRSISNILITRGLCSTEDTVTTDVLQERQLYVDWIPTDHFTHLHQKRCLLNYDKILALIANNSSIYEPIDLFVRKAWNSYTHATFLHQYKQFGLEERDFLKAFARIENIIHDYKELNIR